MTKEHPDRLRDEVKAQRDALNAKLAAKRREDSGLIYTASD
jgi:hypothetical protein